PIDFGNGQLGAIPTTILYRKDKDPVIGEASENEWGEASPRERRDYRLRTHFKPEIAKSPEAKADAVFFLRTSAGLLQSRLLDLNPEVIVGVPGEADEQFRHTLKEIFNLAGYGDVDLVPEPIGALLYHMWNEDISPSQAQGGILVVDFGGGTCDFAFMKGLDVSKAWGNMLLGGRLFDDLFFQWYLNQNYGALKKLVKQGDDYIVHWIGCRRAKEYFSTAMRVNREQTIRASLGELRYYGSFKNLTWDGFIKRAMAYSPHPSFVQYLKQTGQYHGILASGKKINLIQWFQDVLIDGLRKNAISPADIERIILTGGSSQWLFVEDIVRKIFNVQASDQRMFMSENPKAAISEGLVILPHLQIKFARTSRRLKNGLENFVQQRLHQGINKRITDVIERVIAEIAVKLFDMRIKSELYSFRSTGGQLVELKQKLHRVIEMFEPDIQEIVRKEMDVLNQTLPVTIHNLVRDWFRENGITYFGERVDMNSFSRIVEHHHVQLENVSRFDRELVNIIGGFVIAVSATIIAGISGGSGTALIASGPVGWISGAVLAVVAGYLALLLGKDKASETVEKIHFPPGILKMLLSRRRIQKAVERGKIRLSQALHSEMKNSLQKPVQAMVNHLLKNIQREIDGLSVINQL
ncbi:Hsp70 family protein, partial [candidate division KSB1 bacterium]|nr:Hsp70 family protein [candidate division KSB1 bacterium]